MTSANAMLGQAANNKAASTRALALRILRWTPQQHHRIAAHTRSSSASGTATGVQSKAIPQAAENGHQRLLMRSAQSVQDLVHELSSSNL